MATVSKTQAYHGTLTINTVDTVTITGQYGKYRILSRDVHRINFTIAQGTTTPTAPTVDGDNTLALAGWDGEYIEVNFKNGIKGITVSLISDLANVKYSIMGISFGE